MLPFSAPLAASKGAPAWTGFGLLVAVAVALLGFTLLARWIPVYRTVPAGGEESTFAERHLPVPVVAANGLLGATTLVLVPLAALGVGGSRTAADIRPVPRRKISHSALPAPVRPV
ncbi:hypothetical protein ACWC09_40345 [Streptomyces sp. NPDC001617]